MRETQFGQNDSVPRGAFAVVSRLRGGNRHLMCAVVLTALVPVYAQEAPPPRWLDTYLARLEALALIQTLNAEILASLSATRSLVAFPRRLPH